MKKFEEIYEKIAGISIVPEWRCRGLYDLLKGVSTLEGSIAEIGVYKGGTSILMAEMLPEKPIHSFDTFSGMPETSALDKHKKLDFADTSFRQVSKTVAPYKNITLHPGVFPATADAVYDEKFCFVHFDGDIYQSCKDFITFFLPRMVDGGIMAFDDWDWEGCPGIPVAIREAGLEVSVSVKHQAYIKITPETKKANPSITVIVPLYSDSKTSVSRMSSMRRLWISLKTQTDKNFSLVGVDNCSKDDVKGLARSYFSEMLLLDHPIPDHRAGARNAGARASKTSHMIFLDCDMVVYPTFIRNYRTFIANHPNAIGLGNWINYWNSLYMNREFIVHGPAGESVDLDLMTQWTDFTIAHQQLSEVVPGVDNVKERIQKDYSCKRVSFAEMVSAVFCIPREAYFTIGGFDEDFHGYGHEDTMFGHIARLKGIEKFVVDNVLSIHQNHRPPVPDAVHFSDCASSVKNQTLMEEKLKKLAQ